MVECFSNLILGFFLILKIIKKYKILRDKMQNFGSLRTQIWNKKPNGQIDDMTSYVHRASFY